MWEDELFDEIQKGDTVWYYKCADSTRAGVVLHYPNQCRWWKLGMGRNSSEPRPSAQDEHGKILRFSARSSCSNTLSAGATARECRGCYSREY